MKQLLLVLVPFVVPGHAQGFPTPPPKHCSVEATGQLRYPQFSYPNSLKGSGIKGTVVVRAIIGLDGCTSGVTVIRKLHPELDKIAKEAVSSWKFKPAMKDGKAVIVMVNIEINFHETSGGTPN